MIVPDLLYFTALALLGLSLGFIAFVVWDLRKQDRAKAAREAARADRRAR